MKKKIAIVGTQGLPASYGGFETLVEYIADYLSDQFEITIFCSSKVYKDKISNYKGCKLVYIPLHANGVQSIPFDIISILKAINSFDKILILGSSGGLILPFLKGCRKQFILNFGGLDWKREKWGFLAQKILKLSESFAVRNSQYIISDNLGIKEYVEKEYNRQSTLIAYGGDQAQNVVPNKSDLTKYNFLKNSYACAIARIQPDNNIEMILNTFKNNHQFGAIVFIGNWKNSAYGIKVKNLYANQSNIILLDAIYDQRELDLIRSNCCVYIHGHSAGGTNPALVEAMNLGVPIFAYSSGFNEHTTENKAKYFNSEFELGVIFQNVNNEELKQLGIKMQKIANNKYKWKIITDKYAAIFNE